jgi:hypothetical protein
MNNTAATACSPSVGFTLTFDAGLASQFASLYAFFRTISFVQLAQNSG